MKKSTTASIVIILCFWGQYCFNALHAQSQSKSPDGVYTIPLEGNSYITERNKGSKSIFFRTNQTGNLTLYLIYSTPVKSKIGVSCTGKTFKVDLPAGTDRKALPRSEMSSG